MFAALLLDLAEAATKLSEELDPDGMPAPPEDVHGGRHPLIRDESGDSGAGHVKAAKALQISKRGELHVVEEAGA